MRVIIFPFGYPDGMPEIAYLRKTKINCKEEPGADEQDHEPNVPAKIAVEHCKKIVELMHFGSGVGVIG